MSAASVSLIDRVRPVEAGAHVVAAAFLAGTPALGMADGTVLLVDAAAERRVQAHPDAGILVAASDGTRLLTGGDDGRVMATRPDGTTEAVGDAGGQWIDAVASRPDGAFAWSAGKRVQARDPKGAVRDWTAPASVRGLAFAPKGFRLACSHYNGVSLWFPNASTAPDTFDWKGSHLDVTMSPDGRFLVTSMQENALHGWRIADKTHMRMTGYPAKCRSMAWSADGFSLASSGAEGCIVWPFRAKDGPMGKAPLECGVRHAKVSRVAFHPKTPILALGYEDGWVMLCRLADAGELPVRTGGDGPITALAWDTTGNRLLFGAGDGAAGLLELPV